MTDYSGKTPCTGKVVKIMAAQYRKMMAKPHPNLIAVIPDDNDVRIWHFLIGGLDKPYLGGEYIFTLTASNDFPHRPPRLEFVTRNGVFTPGGAICISVGEFHRNDIAGADGAHGWRASLGMMGFASQVINALLCFDASDHGIRIQVQSDIVKSELALVSRTWNRQRQRAIYDKFEKFIATNNTLPPVANILKSRSDRRSRHTAAARTDNVQVVSIDASISVTHEIAINMPSVNFEVKDSACYELDTAEPDVGSDAKLDELDTAEPDVGSDAKLDELDTAEPDVVSGADVDQFLLSLAV